MDEKELLKKYKKFGEYINVDTLRHMVIFELVPKKEVAGISYYEIREALDNFKLKLKVEDIDEYIDNNTNISNDGDALSYDFEIILKENLKDMVYDKIYYYDRYISTLKSKIISMLDVVNILDKIEKNQKIDDVQKELIEKLDFEITDDGILTSDAVRLVRALIYDIFLLIDISKESNDYNNYLSLRSINIYSDSVYPGKDIILDNVYDEVDRTSIVLSDRKKKEKEDDLLEYMDQVTKVLKKDVFKGIVRK